LGGGDEGGEDGLGLGIWDWVFGIGGEATSGGEEWAEAWYLGFGVWDWGGATSGGEERVGGFGVMMLIKLYKKYLSCNFMFKDYKRWVGVKAEINNNERYPIGYKERDIWFCSVGENVGFEEDGKKEAFGRPVLILRVFNKQFCHVVLLSKTGKRSKFYYAFDGRTGRVSVALLSQSRAIDSSRLVRKIGVAGSGDFGLIKEKIKELLKL